MIESYRHIEKHNAKINGYNMNGEYEFYKVLDKKEIKTNVEEFCDRLSY